MQKKPPVELIYIYGKHAVHEALTERPEALRELYLTETFKDEALLAKLAKATRSTPRLLNQKRLPGGLRGDVVHQGIIAGLAIDDLLIPYKTFIQSIKIETSTAFLVLGEVQDPHNVGAMIRSAAAFGFSGVLIPPHNQAPVTGTVVKVSAGMAFRVPLVTISNVNAVLRDLKDRGMWVYGLAGEGSVPLPQEDFSKPTVIVVGNEATGLREKTREVCDTVLSIPIHPRCESLNAAASAAIAMYAWNVRLGQ